MGNESWRKTHEQRCSLASIVRWHRDKESLMFQSDRIVGANCFAAVEERRQVCDPWHMHDQDALEASNKSRKEGSLRQGGHGQGQTRQNCGEGLPSISIEKGFLSAALLA